MALIDRDAAIEAISVYLFINDSIASLEPRKVADYKVFAESILTAVDNVDLVRCRDCRWARPRTLPGETGYRCVFHRIWKGEDGYCDNGEREGE